MAWLIGDRWESEWEDVDSNTRSGNRHLALVFVWAWCTRCVNIVRMKLKDPAELRRTYMNDEETLSQFCTEVPSVWGTACLGSVTLEAALPERMGTEFPSYDDNHYFKRFVCDGHEAPSRALRVRSQQRVVSWAPSHSYRWIGPCLGWGEGGRGGGGRGGGGGANKRKLLTASRRICARLQRRNLTRSLRGSNPCLPHWWYIHLIRMRRLNQGVDSR